MFRRIISIFSDHKKDLFLLLSLILVLSGVALMGPYFVGRVADTIIHRENKWLAVGFAACTLMCKILNKSGATLRSHWNQSRLWFPIQEYIRFRTIDNYLKFSFGQLKKTSTGISKEIIQKGEHATMQLASTLFLNLLPTAIRFVVLSGILLWYYLPLGIVILSGLSFYAFCQYLREKKYTPRIKNTNDLNLASSKVRGEIMFGAPVIKTYSKEGWAKDNYRKYFLDSVAATKSTNLYINKWDNFLSIIPSFTQFGAFALGIFMVYDGKISFGYLTMVEVWWIQMCGMIETVSEQYQPILTYMAEAQKFFELIDTPLAIQEIENPIRLSDIAGTIQFKHVSFGYPKEKGGAGKSVVKNVSLYIQAGSKVAIVGPSGSGKSTLMNLLLRGYDPDAGSIEIDGNNLRNLRLRDYYRHVAVVDQGSVLMDMSIRDNILLGSRIHLSDDHLISLCRDVELDVSQFEEGLDTVVGEAGSKVSGGEKQRITIARALAGNPKILILDEPTSSLDAIKEARIRKVLERVAQGRTTITIAHRLVTIQNADQIFLMDNGEIQAKGTHRDLLKSSGLYMQLVHDQLIEV